MIVEIIVIVVFMFAVLVIVWLVHTFTHFTLRRTFCGTFFNNCCKKCFDVIDTENVADIHDGHMEDFQGQDNYQTYLSDDDDNTVEDIEVAEEVDETLYHLNSIAIDLDNTIRL